jgi:hypothetical protein
MQTSSSTQTPVSNFSLSHIVARRNERQNAISVFNVQSGQAHQQQKKITKPDKVAKVLKEAVDIVHRAQNALAAFANPLRATCPTTSLTGLGQDTETLNKRIEIGTRLVAGYKTAIDSYDKAIGKIKTIGGTVELKGSAARGSENALRAMELEAPRSIAVAGKLREKRAVLYDQMELIQGWTACRKGALAQGEMAAAQAGLVKLEKALQLDPAQRSPDDRALVENQEAVRKSQSTIFKSKRDEAILEFDAAIGHLADSPIVTKRLPDKITGRELLRTAYFNLLSLRKTETAREVLPSFDAAFQAALKAYGAIAEADSGTEPQAGQQQGVDLEEAPEKIKACVEQGTAVIDYLDELIQTADQALALQPPYKDDRKAVIEQNRATFREKRADVTMKIDVARYGFLQQMAKPMLHLYDGKLVEDFERVCLVMMGLKSIHHACSINLKTGQPNAGLPDHLLHEVLKTVPEQYEDGARQLAYLARKFEKKGKGVSNNDALVKCLKDLAQGAAKMMELAEFQLGLVETSDKANQGTEADAREWIRKTLEELEKLEKAGKKDVAEEVAAEFDELDLEPGEEEVEESAAPEPEQQKAARQLDKAIAAAEKAGANGKTLQLLQQWDADSRRHCGNARDGQKEGAGLRYVEDEMKLAANEESKLAAKKNQIATKFEKALAQMDDGHPKYADFKRRVAELKAQAEGHERNGKAFLEEGERLAIQVSKEHAPTHSLFHFHCDKGQVEKVSLAAGLELDVLRDGKPRLNPRTNEPLKDYIDEYAITLKGGKKYVAHFHYRDKNADKKDFTACHFKTWAQRRQGFQYVLREARAGRTVELHRGRTNLETLNQLRRIMDQKTSTS